MKIDIIVGGTYGDEGKGKVVNALTEENRYDYVFRVNASTNASHCVNLGPGKNYVTKQLPSVFFSPDVKFVVSNGTFLNLGEFEKEALGRPDKEMIRGNIYVASSTPLILPGYIRHNKSDDLRQKVGSTNQGTGIAMMARVSKHAVYLYDVTEEIEEATKLLEGKIKRSYDYLKIKYTPEELRGDVLSLCRSWLSVLKTVGRFSVDYPEFIYNLVNSDSSPSILIEGCNGILLDNINGVNPYTTSCSTTAAALLGYANLPMSSVRSTYVVMGAYFVCLNKRPFITEFTKDSEEYKTVLSEGIEIDNAEMMQRRIGWFDIPTAKRALIGHKGCSLVLSKVDVISKFKEIKVATHYSSTSLPERDYKILPENTSTLGRLVPVYRTFKSTEIEEFIVFLESELGVKIEYVGTGSETKSIIKR